jgi:RimJ/RimL family protein N-acetyltransferase
MKQELIELNVFTWNASAIRCYEKAGLIKNLEKTMEFDTNGEKWIAFNMSIDRENYEKQH